MAGQGNLNLIPNNGYLLSQKLSEGGRLAVQLAKLQNQPILVKNRFNHYKVLRSSIAFHTKEASIEYGKFVSTMILNWRGEGVPET